MTQQQILDELEHLTLKELLEIIEAATLRAKVEVKQSQAAGSSTTQEKLVQAAVALQADYASDEELKAFTSLDTEEFIHAEK